MENVKKNNLIFYLVIFGIIALPIISIGENLGLQFDSILPDYAATQLLDGQTYEVKWFTAWPILAQVYHGCISMYISAIMIMIIGTTGVVQHRLINAVIITACLFIIDKIMKEFQANLLFRRIIIIIFAFMPTMLGFCLTQYYIELPGVAMILMAFLLIIKEKASYIKVWSAFVLLGLAFYSYFNFLFLIPGYMLILILKVEEKKEKINKLILASIGVLPGAFLYILGYAVMVFDTNGIRYNFILILLIFTLTIVILEFSCYRFVLKDKQKICLIIGGFIAIIMIIGFFVFKESIFAITSTLNATGNSATILTRLRLLFKLFSDAIGSISSERVIFGYQVTLLEKITLVLTVIINGVYLVSIFINKAFREKSNAWKYLLVIFVYLCCCIPLVTRMQTQHFVPIAFLSFTVVTIELSEIICCNVFNIKFICIIKIVGILGSIFLIFVYASDRYKIIDEIFETGGNGYYTKEINRLAEDALQNLKDGKKEIYVFPEWGFMTGFNYITNNNIAFSNNSSEEAIESYLAEGYEVVILFWNKEEIENYMDSLKAIGITDIELLEYVGIKGQVEFYKIEVHESSGN